MKRALPLLAALLLFASHSSLGATEPLIVDQGVSRAQIVIAAENRPRMATLELQCHIQQMSGARLPIVTTPDASLPVRIYVGMSPATDKLGVSEKDLNYGAFRMVSGPEWLVFMGNDFDFVPPPHLARKRNDKGPELAWKKAVAAKTDMEWGFSFQSGCDWLE